MAKTYWNGEPARCRRVVVRVAESDQNTPRLAWWRGLDGTERRAVEVIYGGQTFYLDDDDVPPEVHAEHVRRRSEDPRLAALTNQPPGRAGDGWYKVTVGRGSPEYGHRTLRVAEVLRVLVESPAGHGKTRFREIDPEHLHPVLTGARHMVRQGQARTAAAPSQKADLKRTSRRAMEKRTRRANRRKGWAANLIGYAPTGLLRAAFDIPSHARLSAPQEKLSLAPGRGGGGAGGPNQGSAVIGTGGCPAQPPRT